MTSPPRKSPAPSSEPPRTSLGDVLGGLAVMVGIGAMGVYMLDLHGHTCDRCGRRWRHFGAFNLGDASSHTCSSCGEVQWWKCGAPHVMRGSEFAPRGPALGAVPAPARVAAPGLPRIATAPVAVSASPALPAPVSVPRASLLALQPRRS